VDLPADPAAARGELAGARSGRGNSDAFAKGGKVTMPLQTTFWVEAFGMLVERFGTPRMVNGGTASVRPQRRNK